jgi:hypothetical protein
MIFKIIFITKNFQFIFFKYAHHNVRKSDTVFSEIINCLL